MGLFNRVLDLVLDKMADRALGLDTPGMKEIERQFERSTAYPIKVAGVKYENRMEVIEKMSETSSVFLQREPDNPYDSNAIAVYEKETNQQIGYLPRLNNTAIAKAMDVGLAVYASIYKIQHEIEKKTAKEINDYKVTLIIAFHPNHIPEKIEAEKRREAMVKQISLSRTNYPVSSTPKDENNNWDDRGSVWDEYDEDGVPYEEYNR